MREIPKDELKFNKLQDKYFDKFGTNYGADFGSSLSFEEHNAIMEKAIKTGQPVKQARIPRNIIV